MLLFVLIFIVFYISLAIDWDEIYNKKVQRYYWKWHKKFKEMLIDLEK